MDTFTPPEPIDPEPVPTRDRRGDGPSRVRLLATSVAVAGLTATGGLAVILSTAATSGAGDAASVANGAPAQPAAPQASAAANGTTPGTTTPATTPSASADPNSTIPGTTQNGTTTQPQQGGRGPFSGGQPPQSGQGSGPGHAASGGS